ncbi:MAG: hypothetical protein ABS948_10235 [Solibacillus sp.]
MRIVVQSLAGSIVLYVVYFLCIVAIGLAQTYLYKPQFAPNTLVLQQEIAFGYVAQFPYVGVSFIVVAFVIGFVLMIRDRKRRLSS